MEVRIAGITITLLGSLLGGCGNANVYDMSPDGLTPNSLNSSTVRRL